MRRILEDLRFVRIEELSYEMRAKWAMKLLSEIDEGLRERGHEGFGLREKEGVRSDLRDQVKADN